MKQRKAAFDARNKRAKRSKKHTKKEVEQAIYDRHHTGFGFNWNEITRVIRKTPRDQHQIVLYGMTRKNQK